MKTEAGNAIVAGKLGLPRQVWGSILLLALLNNALPFTLFGWGQTHIASGLASILNATTPIWGVLVAHFFTRDERMNPRKIAGVLLGFGGVATMIGPALLSHLGTSGLAQLACVAASLSYALAAVWAHRFRAQGISPLSVTTGQMTAAAVIMLPMSMLVSAWPFGIGMALRVLPEVGVARGWQAAVLANCVPATVVLVAVWTMRGVLHRHAPVTKTTASPRASASMHLATAPR